MCVHEFSGMTSNECSEFHVTFFHLLMALLVLWPGLLDEGKAQTTYPNSFSFVSRVYNKLDQRAIFFLSLFHFWKVIEYFCWTFLPFANAFLIIECKEKRKKKLHTGTNILCHFCYLAVLTHFLSIKQFDWALLVPFRFDHNSFETFCEGEKRH